MLPERHVTENSMVSTSTTQFILRTSFPYAYMSLHEAHVLRIGFFFEEDRETHKIPLDYALNYAPGAPFDRKFHGKYLRY